MFFEMRRPIESHVFGKVGQAQLVIVLQHGAGFDNQAQLQFFLRPAIFLNVIGQPIGQMTHHNLWTNRQRLGKLVRAVRSTGRCQQQCCGANVS